MPQKIIKLKLGKCEIPFLYEKESSKMKPIGKYSDLEPIPFHTNMEKNELIAELFTQMNKKYQQSSFINGPIKNLNYKSTFNYSTKEEKENVCKTFKEKYEEGEILGTGAYGIIRNWGSNVVIKTEKCDEYNLSHNIKKNDPDYDNYFVKSSKLRLEILRPLIEKDLTPEIFEIEKCDNLCITIMEKIVGKTLRDVLEDSSRSDKYSIIVKVIDAIIKLHQIMKDNGHDFGHGDLNSGNIMITDETGEVKFIDFVFERKESFENDWYHFFYGIRKYIRMDQVHKIYFQETGKNLEIDSFENIKKRVLYRRH